MSTSVDPFWAKVFFKEYIRHYRKMTDEEIVRDVKLSMDDLEMLVDDSVSFGSAMVRAANERIEKNREIGTANGMKGGRPKSTPTTIPKQLKPPTISEVYEFAQEHKMWDDFARDWYERNYTDRDGCDKEGNVILNWKGALTNDWKKNKESYKRRMQG